MKKKRYGQAKAPEDVLIKTSTPLRQDHIEGFKGECKATGKSRAELIRDCIDEKYPSFIEVDMFVTPYDDGFLAFERDVLGTGIGIGKTEKEAKADYYNKLEKVDEK